MTASHPQDAPVLPTHKVMPARTAMAGFTPLPRPLTRLIAREDDVAAISSLLRDPAGRLLTLTGPGGVGKTRLAIAAAGEVTSEYPDGIVYVDLSAVRNSSLVLNEIAGCLGLRDIGVASLRDRLSTAIAGRRVLLVVDNFEQVVEAAPDLVGLLGACPGVVMLVTSRIRLRVSGEREYPVAPLSLDAAANAEESGAVRLFLERAAAIRPDLDGEAGTMQAIAGIVRRVDGLPLAIELAAARVKALPPVALLHRLEQRLPLLSGGARDLPLRQQTMRDTIGWSYDLLDADYQALFRRFGVFVGGFTLEAAEAIGSDDVDGHQVNVLDGMTTLIEHSLLRQVAGSGGPRYRMLETVREYARDRLEASGEVHVVHRRHAEYFLALAEADAPGLTGPAAAEWVDRLEREKGNLRAALRRSLEGEEVDTATRLGASLWRIWERRWDLIEGRAHLDRILALAPGEAPTVTRYRALTGAGVLAALQADYSEAIRHSEEALAGWRQLGDQRGVARTLLCLSIIARYRDDYASAETLGQETLAAFRAINDRWGIGHTLANLGMVAWVQGDRATGTARYEEALGHLREVGDDAGIFEVVLELGKGASDAGDLERAATLLAECLALSESMRDGASRGESLNELGVVAEREGEHVRARELFAEAAALAQESGDRRQLAWVTLHLGNVDIATGNIGSAVTHVAEALDLFCSMGNRVGIAQSLDAIARCALIRSHHEPAVRLLGTSAAMFGAIGAAPPPGRDPVEAAGAIRSRLSGEAFTRAWNEGWVLDPADAVAEALALAADLAAERLDDLPPPVADLGLTPREIDVARLLAEGMSDRGIAEMLSISERTAGNHVQHVMQKIGVESRTAAAVWAVRHRLA